MIEAITLWNEPNNPAHWDVELDPDWRQFARMANLAADQLRAARPGLPLVLGGLAPADPEFVDLLGNHGVLDRIDVVGIHGFPLDWSHWMMDEWPDQVAMIEEASGRPVWVTGAGVSSFGAEEVQEFGLKRTAELLRGRVERVFWDSLLDLPPTWEPQVRHDGHGGSDHERQYHMGLIHHDGTRKQALAAFPDGLGICQWFRLRDPRLEFAVEWLHRMGVRRIRTGISWADWLHPQATTWFDRQMAALQDFDVTVTLCFTPPARGRRAHHTSPPLVPEEFAEFALQVVERYVPAPVTEPAR